MKENEDTNVFKARLREARLARQLGQSDLAGKSGLPPASISHFESGARKPSFENLRRLAQALQVSTDFLLGRVDHMSFGVAGDPLYRHMENLSGRDREYAEVFLMALAAKGKTEKEDP